SENLSRCYVQVPLADKTTDWSDERFWDVFANRLPSDVALRLTTGPSIEKTIAAVRSFVCEPMQWGNLYLVGDSAHIVPPTGAKGLNLAVSDVRYLFEALLVAFGKAKSKTALDGYSERALARVWKAMRFSNQMTQLLHQVESEDSFAGQMRRAGLRHLASSETARRDFAENYVGPSF
ncbi:FAD-dependent monooxygenase, partial [Yoonia sp.]|nr:FAD-dependent monooxygenase [Yoonia sp.]